MAAHFPRKQLSIQGMLSTARHTLAKIPDDSGGEIPLVDCPSCRGWRCSGSSTPRCSSSTRIANRRPGRQILGHSMASSILPATPNLRERLDLVDPHLVRPLYKTLFSALQRGKGLEGFSYLAGLQRPAHPPVEGPRPALHPRCQGGRSHVPVRMGPYDTDHRRTHGDR